MKKILTLSLSLLFSLLGLAQSDEDITRKTVTKAKLQSHIKFLASDELKGRKVGSQEIDIASRYIATQLERYGVQAFDEYPDYLQPIGFQTVSPPSSGNISVGAEDLKISEDFLLMMGDDFNYQGEFVFIGYGNEQDFADKDVSGKWVVSNCGDGQSSSVRDWLGNTEQKRQRAEATGALGLIELYNSPQISWALLMGYLGGDQTTLKRPLSDGDVTPNIWLNNSNNSILSILNNVEGLTIEVGAREVRYFDSYNVVGYVPGTEKPDEYVMYSAHYDHVGVGRPDSTGDEIYNGARDNAVGTVTVLSAAQSIGQYPTKRSGLFVLFTAEEVGLLGSKHFADNAPIPLDRIKFCFNSDNGGYNDITKTTIIGLNRTTASDEIIKASKAFGLEAMDDPAPEQGLFDRSDNVSFARKGIPAPTFGLGFTAFDEEITKYYHQPGDEWETLDYQYLEKFFRAYVLSSRLIANREELPFWVEGDKYFEAGTELYKK